MALETSVHGEYRELQWFYLKLKTENGQNKY